MIRTDTNQPSRRLAPVAGYDWLLRRQCAFILTLSVSQRCNPLLDRSWIGQGRSLIGTQSVEVIGPSLQHLATLRQSLSAIVGSTYLITLGMCKLQLNQIRVPALLIEAGLSERAESMPCHLRAAIAHAAKRRVNGVIAHRSRRCAQ